MGISFITEVS